MSDLPNLLHPDTDPFLWLEEVDGPRALAWVDAQTAATAARLAGPGFERDRDTLRTLLDRPDNLPVVTRRGGLLYNYWKDATHPRGLWRRTSLESYRTASPDWDILLDLDALAAAEHEDWIWQGATTLPPEHHRAILRLSRGGGDAVVMREFDLVSRQFDTAGFVLPEAKGGIDWIDRDTLLLQSALGGVTSSGYSRTVRLWHRGTDPLAAPVIFEVPEASMVASAQYDRERDQLVFMNQTGFFDMELHVGTREGPTQRLDLPTDIGLLWDRGWVALRRRTEWTVDGRTYARDTLLGIGLDALLAGSRDFAVLFVPGERRSLQGFFWSDGQLVLSILDDLRPVYRVITPGPWTEAALPGLPAIGTVSAWPLDAEAAEQDGTLLGAVQDPLTPASLLLLTKTGAETVKQAPRSFDPAGLVVTRHEAVSADGTRVPYVQVGPPGLTGEAPVHLTAYGGFGISLLPTYKGGLGRLWLEPGGTMVVANLRGGGEFGTAWHDAGRGTHKIDSHDDFAAVAQDLVTRGVTRPGRIAAEGGSNGGLLIANMLTRYPERFGALFCTIPLIDMRRYTKLLAGASWIAEYGDPDVAEDWAALQHISAYHLARAGQPYPPTLIATARRDDRVHPGHARKMAAKLQALGYDTLFYEPPAGGHGYGKDNAEVAAYIARGVTFMRRSIGWS